MTEQSQKSEVAEENLANQKKVTKRYFGVALTWSLIYPPLGPHYYRHKKYTLFLIAIWLVFISLSVIISQKLGSQEHTIHKLSIVDFAGFCFLILYAVLSLILTIKSKGEYTERNLGGLRTRIFKKLLIVSVVPLVIFLTLFLSILTDYKLHYFETETTSVTGKSMFPSILDGDRVTVYGEPEDWKKGVIYLISDERKLDDKVQHKSLVKRLIGFAGDTIEVKDGRVTRNGDKFTYVRINEQLQTGGVTIIPSEIWHYYYEIDNFGNKYIVILPNEEQKTSDLKRPNIKTKVPENEIFFLGDNRVQSFDSRDFGTVNENQIEGAVLAVVWSYNRTFGFLFKRMFQNLNREKHSYLFKYKRTF